MAYPPNPNPTPTPTPRPVTSGYVSPADYVEALWLALQAEDQDEMVSMHSVTSFIEQQLEVLRAAEL